MEKWLDENGKLHRDDAPAVIRYWKNGKKKFEKWYVHGRLRRKIVYQMNGNKIREDWYRNRKLHRVDGPALIRYMDRTVSREEYYIKGELHREDGPAIISYINGKVTKKEYCINGERHRIDGPAVIAYNPTTGNVLRQEWYLNGGRHRMDSPAVIAYNPTTGNVVRQEWYLNGELHRIDNPAVIEYGRTTDVVLRQEWYLNGVLHRIDGPAVIEYYQNGTVQQEMWFNAGELSRDDGPSIVEYDVNGVEIMSEEMRVANERREIAAQFRLRNEEILKREMYGNPERKELEVKEEPGDERQRSLRSKCNQGAEDLITGDPLDFDENDVVFIFDEKLEVAECLKREEISMLIDNSKVTLWPPHRDGNADVKLAKLPFTAQWVRNLQVIVDKPDRHCFYVSNRERKAIGSSFGVSALHGAQELVGTVNVAPMDNPTIRDLETTIRRD